MSTRNPISFAKEISAPGLAQAIDAVTAALKTEGFGVLTRIDFHDKMKEKLGKDLRPTVILGACMPALAYEAYQRCPEVTALLPCNAVVSEVGPGKFRVELTKPSSMMEILGDRQLVELASAADESLKSVLGRV